MSSYGALGVARTLGRLGIPVYLVCNEQVLPIAFSRFWKEAFTWDLSAPSARSVRFLADIGRRMGTRPILLCTTDRAAVFVADNAGALEEVFIFPKVPSTLVRSLTNKWQMLRAAKENGVPAPETMFPRSREDVVKFLDGARFPIVLKGADPLGPRGGMKQIVNNAHDLLEKYDGAADGGSANLVLQEYIPGDDQAVWMCNAYFDRQSECLAAFTGRKIRQFPPNAGVASLSIYLPNEVVEATTKHFMRAVGYRGAVGIGYRYDARDGCYKVLDVNPRVSGVFRLFSDKNGMDVVRACYFDLTGQPVPPIVPSTGRKWMVEEDIYAALGYARQGKLTFGQWVRSLRGVEELQWFVLDDPMPFLVWCCLRLLDVFRATARGLWGSVGKKTFKSIKTTLLKPRLS